MRAVGGADRTRSPERRDHAAGLLQPGSLSGSGSLSRASLSWNEDPSSSGTAPTASVLFFLALW